MITKIYEKTKNFIKTEWKFLLFFMILIVVTQFPLPYVIEIPGGAIDLSDRVVIDSDYKSEGSFNMAYVTMIKSTPATMLIASIRSDWDVESMDDFTLENEDYEESVNRDKLYLKEAIANASIAAFKEAGKYIEITNSNNYVSYISKESNTTLKLNDAIKKVDGVPVMNLAEMKEVIKDKKAGDVVTFEVVRDNENVEANGVLYDTSDGVKIGIISITEYEYESDPQVKVTFKDSESGPSGGLMTALEIYNRLTEEDLTKGRKIIGTGTIDIDGKVGIIGGVKYKLAGAVKKKAEVFICPNDNLEEALEIKDKFNYDIKIIGVDTLSEAIKELKE